MGLGRLDAHILSRLFTVRGDELEGCLWCAGERGLKSVAEESIHSGGMNERREACVRGEMTN